MIGKRDMIGKDMAPDLLNALLIKEPFVLSYSFWARFVCKQYCGIFKIICTGGEDHLPVCG